MVQIVRFSISSTEVFRLPFESVLNPVLNKTLILWLGQVASTSGLGIPQRKMNPVSGLVAGGYDWYLSSVPPPKGCQDQTISFMAARGNSDLDVCQNP